MKTIPTELTIDPEFAALIPPLAPEEREQLERNILADGCRDPLTAWDGVIVDGHNRYEICTRNGIPFDVVEKYFADRDEAMDWMDANQLGRRNLSPDAFTLLLGRRYNRAKKAHGGDRKSSPQSEDLKTSEAIAVQHGVSRATVERAGQFADAVDKLQLGAEVVSGRVDSTRKAVIQAASALPENPTPQQLEEAKKHVHVSKNSGNNEWYTPYDYIKAAHSTMGGIDLDPASSVKANETVEAAKIYTADDDGRTQQWAGRVWMNPPYAQPLIADFCERLAECYDGGDVSAACVLVNNATETAWFHRLLSLASAVCFPRGRVKFLDPSGKPGAPLQGQAIIYLGNDPRGFCGNFGGLGLCLTK